MKKGFLFLSGTVGGFLLVSLAFRLIASKDEISRVFAARDGGEPPIELWGPGA